MELFNMEETETHFYSFSKQNFHFLIPSEDIINNVNTYFF